MVIQRITVIAIMLLAVGSTVFAVLTVEQKNARKAVLRTEITALTAVQTTFNTSSAALRGLLSSSTANLKGRVKKDSRKQFEAIVADLGPLIQSSLDDRNEELLGLGS